MAGIASFDVWYFGTWNGPQNKKHVELLINKIWQNMCCSKNIDWLDSVFPWAWLLIWVHSYCVQNDTQERNFKEYKIKICNRFPNGKRTDPHVVHLQMYPSRQLIKIQIRMTTETGYYWNRNIIYLGVRLYSHTEVCVHKNVLF